ncbi:MAG: peroxiredoxin [Rhizobiaceae bacterium]
MAAPEDGDLAPGFSLPTDGGGQFSLDEIKGKPVVLFFYPKDNTSGCTAEAVGFSERKADFEAIGITVAGMSPNSVKDHDKFRDKHSLTVTLISDEDKSTLDAYGVWKEKSMYGRKYMGVERSTFLISGEGKILHSWRKVKVPGHVDEVLEAAREALG